MGSGVKKAPSTRIRKPLEEAKQNRLSQRRPAVFGSNVAMQVESVLSRPATA